MLSGQPGPTQREPTNQLTDSSQTHLNNPFIIVDDESVTVLNLYSYVLNKEHVMILNTVFDHVAEPWRAPPPRSVISSRLLVRGELILFIKRER